ncbi:GNAT family N-acetyltransferase [Ramlibacter tataouinensis]|uniref:GNAT family N-acetyltransferase n=1 Tax=Ramlibacter tataouinensis TaxID=94132 RepID=UPI0022F3BB8A|nr:GNAT family N-acetyltransferase [Ramlibacter tataouinensis]WBY03154.1 GNAT family N-acetyltransferase [Ramlibacter tataouinensis]
MISTRAMTEADLGAVLAIQAECYGPAMNETRETVLARLRAFPHTAWVAHDTQGACAYLVAYESRLGRVTALGGDFRRSERADSLYLHDLAVSPRAKGRGAGRLLVEQALQQARHAGLAHSCLVSVQDSQAFWRSFGYEPRLELPAESQPALQTYGPGACYMARAIA